MLIDGYEQRRADKEGGRESGSRAESSSARSRAHAVNGRCQTNETRYLDSNLPSTFNWQLMTDSSESLPCTLHVNSTHSQIRPDEQLDQERQQYVDNVMRCSSSVLDELKWAYKNLEPNEERRNSHPPTLQTRSLSSSS